MNDLQENEQILFQYCDEKGLISEDVNPNGSLLNIAGISNKNKNVFADFSGLVLGNFSDKFERYMKNELEEMITYAGNPRYLLYGTDWPISNMSSYLNFMKQLDLPEEKKELILWKNAAELFKIDTSKL
jgi:predicted TIM-barrel fold metal-dependent hydrolase